LFDGSTFAAGLTGAVGVVLDDRRNIPDLLRERERGTTKAKGGVADRDRVLEGSNVIDPPIHPHAHTHTTTHVCGT
jgi:hypothetical protein